MCDHAQCVAAHKAEIEMKTAAALKDDSRIHECRMKKALDMKKDNVANKHETLAESNLIEKTWNTQEKEEDKCEAKCAANHDANMHDDRTERATNFQHDLANKKHADFEREELSNEEHRKKAALRHAAATNPDGQKVPFQ